MAVGGDYKTLSSDQSINTIININPSQKYDNVGFRFALYVLQ